MLRWSSLLLLLLFSGSSRGAAEYDDYDSYYAEPLAAVYTMTNSPDGNEIVVFTQDVSGQLTETGRYATGGIGSGAGTLTPEDPLGSQGPLITTKDDAYVLAVNAGDNTLSVLAIDGATLTLTDVVSSEGSYPVSVTACDNLVYVVNGGFTGSLVGYSLDDDGKLTYLPDSQRDLGALNLGPVPNPLTSPGQVSFTADCSQLVVNLKDAAGLGGLGGLVPILPGRILVYPVDTDDGLPSEEPVVTGTDDILTFSFTLLELENAGLILHTTDAVVEGVSTFVVADDGSVSRLQAPVSNGGQFAICWSAVYADEFLYVANTGSNSISSYTIDADGLVTLQESVAVEFDFNRTQPIDIAVLEEEQMVYQVGPGTGSVYAYSIAEDGSLTEVGVGSGVGTLPELPATAPGTPGGPVGVAAVPLRGMMMMMMMAPPPPMMAMMMAPPPMMAMMAPPPMMAMMEPPPMMAMMAPPSPMMMGMGPPMMMGMGPPMMGMEPMGMMMMGMMEEEED